MKTMPRLLAFLLLAVVPLLFAGGKPGSAPGIKKKVLEIYNVSVAAAGTSAIVSWETNARCTGDVLVEDYGIIDEKPGTRHSVTIPYLIPGVEYEYTIHSYSELYGAATPYVGVFTL